MNAERWRRIDEIYSTALERAASERASFLESACGGDETLRAEVERLIEAQDRAGDFLIAPAWKVGASALVAAATKEDRGMSLVGRHIATYEILAPLGVGGMGEVYRARDTKLNRDVAVKVLPELLALDADRVARFKREAHVLASLNHPNIAAIYGFEEAPSTSSGQAAVHALVLELVEGPTLADRIARGRMPLDEALPVARQIAEALEAAHERGIVHRDLKPANIKVRTDGTVKVLDFGLAKVLEPELIGADPSQSPTAHNPAATQPGLIIGTAAYMAPEQARGRRADKRADMWAFGCVLYEMLAGVRAFSGQDVSETLAAVIRGEPDWHRLTDETPASIRRLLHRCLAKDLKGRLSDASTARLDIDEALNAPPLDIPAALTTSRRTERFAWASALVLVAALAVAIGVWALRPLPPAGELRFEINTPPTTGIGGVSVAISPDGRRIVFVATSEGVQKLWVRSLDSDRAAPLARTDGAAAPFWAPDSLTVAFFTSIDNQLKRIDIENGSVNVVATVPLGTCGTWNQDGTILFSQLGAAGISRVSADGGQASEVTRVGKEEPSHQCPQFLPDGRHFLYYVLDGKPPGVRVGQLGESETKRLLDADAPAVFVPAGYLLFPRQGTLFAQAFDPVRLALAGNPFRVAEHVFSEFGALSASTTGTLVFRTGSAVDVERRPLVWFDRSGKEIGRVDTPVSGWRPSLSPDGRRVALMGVEQAGPPDIYLVTVDRGVPTRFTTNGAVNFDPIWSPDGSRIVFTRSDSKRPEIFELYWKPVAGDRSEELLLATRDKGSTTPAASDWSRRGFLLYNRFNDPPTDVDISAFPMNGDRTPFEVVETRFEERDAQFSPDGNWIAYQSNESGRFEIYVQQFPRGINKRISTTGGAQVRWPRDGKELFYIAMDGRLMAVPIRLTADDVEHDTPIPLFPTRVGGAVQGGLNRQQYVVTSAGQRFLMSTILEVSPSPIEVILNWKPQR